MKNFSVIIIATLIIILVPLFFVRAEERVDYKGNPAVDSDLDGLTDEGEKQIYHTDPNNPDTDGDGYLDGAEVLSGTDTLNADDPGNPVLENINASFSQETPWVWYISRSAGLLGFIFLWLTVFLGLSIRNPIFKKIIEPIYSFGPHCFLGAIAVFWTLIHGTSFLFHGNFAMGLKDIAIPFYSKTTLVNTNYLALGIMAFYMMAIMTVTSYLRNHMKHWLWRALHFLNPVAFIFIIIHGYMNGTDMKNAYIASAYLISSGFLILIYLTNLGTTIWNKYKSPPALYKS
jgi:methionine sulfoxide reductase heme-binding subunit